MASMVSRRNTVSALALVVAGIATGSPAGAETILNVGIGTQDTTTNTATVGVVVRQLKIGRAHV